MVAAGDADTRCEDPRPPAEEIGPREAKAAALGSSNRVATDERRGSGWKPGSRTDDVTLGAADVGDDRAVRHQGHGLSEELNVLLDGRREDHQVGGSDAGHAGRRAIDGAAGRGVRQHLRAIDGRDQDRRPALAHRQRNRSADEPEANDGDAFKWWIVGSGHRLTSQ